ncbi:lysophospholipid acyltransferase family protein [Spartinivicinus poritis]|uniref:L-ornithine N(alpha)-acyltransferase n=1 Tax=Spartinivicinus poritis TaxID=2994640 RepID=A0ABT5UET1_9GAMM|nr:lysophospholipid acyltransferase family protein [Spartinivicinus sp. A2-2]MDE1464890.1 lysophospholipid acyltransferase family protein [Spartinivicinus sp. A2-2]
MTQQVTPFQLPKLTRLGIVEGVLERLSGLRYLDTLYQRRHQQLQSSDPAAFAGYTLDALGVDYSVVEGQIENIPYQGAGIVVANHPFGAIEGVILAHLLLRYRPDVKIMANHWLQQIPELADAFIGVDVFATADSQRRNRKGLKAALDWVRQGGLLMIFPAGEVSTFNFREQQVVDRPWNRLVATIMRRTQAPVTPIYISGKNSWLFHAAGMINANLRTGLLVREMINKKNRTIELHIGQQIPFKEVTALDSDQALTEYLRMNTYLLAHTHARATQTDKQPTYSPQPIAQPQTKAALAHNVAALPDSCLLIDNGEFKVYCASADQLPTVLPEIGRLRELTFRAVGEGTGESVDLDEYDQHYLHLFIWFPEQQTIVGAYRLGRLDQLLEKQGMACLYTRSLFKFDQRFLSKLGRALEVGRSFVCAEYQKSLAPLFLLWKGIATYVASNPQYKTLFGPVSISSDYQEFSRHLMARCLSAFHKHEDMAEFVKPTNPLPKYKSNCWQPGLLKGLADIQQLSKLITRIEGDKGIPVLLRQYLKLNGQLVCFNVDKDFNDALDGLIIVDLLAVPEKTLQRYMGKTGIRQFYDYHQRLSQVS